MLTTVQALCLFCDAVNLQPLSQLMKRPGGPGSQQQVALPFSHHARHPLPSRQVTLQQEWSHLRSDADPTSMHMQAGSALKMVLLQHMPPRRANGVYY